MWKVKVASALYGGFLVVATILDPTVTAALIGGIALLLNTILTFWLMRYERDRDSVDGHNDTRRVGPNRRRRKHRRPTEHSIEPDHSNQTDTKRDSLYVPRGLGTKALG